MHGALEEVSPARFAKTTLAVGARKVELENKCLRLEKKSLQSMIEESFSTGSDQKRKKGGYILSNLQVKNVGIASELLNSVPKRGSCIVDELGPFTDRAMKRCTPCADAVYDKKVRVSPPVPVALYLGDAVVHTKVYTRSFERSTEFIEQMLLAPLKHYARPECLKKPPNASLGQEPSLMIVKFMVGSFWQYPMRTMRGRGGVAKCYSTRLHIGFFCFVLLHIGKKRRSRR